MDEVTAAIAAAVEQQSATTREIASSVQAVSHATAETAHAMEHVVMVADGAGQASRDVSEGAAGIGREAETLRTEVDQFLAAVKDARSDRRRFERIPGNGAIAALRTPGRNQVRAAIGDLSRGGANLTCDWKLAAGTTVEIDLPQAQTAVSARVVRCNGERIAIVFGSDAVTIASIDRALDALPRERRVA